MSEHEHWVTTEEAARHINVSVWTIRRYIHAGKIEARRMGPRLIRVNPASLQQFGTDIGETK